MGNDTCLHCCRVSHHFTTMSDRRLRGVEGERTSRTSNAVPKASRPHGRTFVAHDDLDDFLRPIMSAETELVRDLDDGISVVNKCERTSCREKGIEKVQHFGMGKHDIVAA